MSIYRAKRQKTYNTRSSLVVTDPATTPALIWLSIGDQTGSRFLRWLWSYVPGSVIGWAI
ncbi:uncharacterized protein TRIREDRAFT_70921 [Trichoderma reesei QM6a]|uniref:Predicted protein n=2 Tax=Hypocrea jecorina TaxID=51453 RepID=G0RXB3_HYPJQ|nr:uncharacterized protein TRIREDRAFT_70921 [Trichoderma reesei QM6a]EGR44167.1 predicted protein [Trichoderma reesei QM6a]ETR96788.1 hypothetical protein M419DRAFT_93253 [Trichoderma reesei RUT C-30]